MSAKIELNYLVSMKKNEIFKVIRNVFSHYGIFYNMYQCGEYSYWTEGPIWEFKGLCSNIVEKEISETNIVDVMEVCSKYFSPDVRFDMSYNNNIIPIRVAIYETEDSYHEVCVYMNYNTLEIMNVKRLKDSNYIEDLFYGLAEKLNACYAMCGCETTKIEENPESMSVSDKSLGIFNYFSKNIFSMDTFKNVSLRYFDIVQNKDSIIIKRNNSESTL